ncbi:MAG TPA: hypothetical protein VMY41_08250, partial [Thermohalobaculum sp.]|nr:hypothetical protein [Thermohalobaculum sp.]
MPDLGPLTAALLTFTLEGSCRRPPSPWTRFAEFRLASAARVALSAPEARFEPITVLLSAKLVPLR